MSVKMRLARGGAKKRPYYRIVVMDSRSRRESINCDDIGYYDPLTNPPTIEIKMDRVEHWTGQGALPTDTVAKLIRSYKAKLAGK
ncbi:30S ribosomal protein S16 [Myxococcota bacterium]|jgi:small subunit ribosomal protein S16|nr:30S ribosomal protein S16 [Myxococcota bacterium]MBU1243549.1 30S ribosomal protein S16 [Myxococcota bacterium]MBU1411989.1 30S ribosomal protein S16 [Myxococcota bacterium]MBU1508857.1 30S ribosomal protein S16 [Myxococcota bacterium]